MVAKIEMDPSEPTMTSSSIPFPKFFLVEKFLVEKSGAMAS